MSGNNHGGRHDKESDLSKWISPGKAVVQEFLVDVLGGLVPGILLVAGVVLAVFPALVDLHATIAPEAAQSFLMQVERALGAVAAASGTLIFFACVGLALVTYVAGHIYYRKDPKEPDRASFRLLARGVILSKISETSSITKSSWKAHAQLWCLQLFHKLRRSADPMQLAKKYIPGEEENLRKEFERDLGAGNVGACEFPYPNFKDYLTHRQLHYLTALVAWDKDSRSKIYINVLKLRLMHTFPERCRQIVHNEAHVRLASGTWYVAGALSRMAVLGFSIVAMSTLYGAWHTHDWRTASLIGAHFWTVVMPCCAYIVCRLLRNRIEAFFHYQRMREVVFVLESGYYAFKATPWLLKPPFDLEKIPPEMPTESTSFVQASVPQSKEQSGLNDGLSRKTA